MITVHEFQSGKTDGPDASQIQPSHWNAGHLFTGGVNTYALTRDNTNPDGATWSPHGDWFDVAFASGNFHGTGGMTWNVTAVDVNAFALIGKVCIYSFLIGASTLGGTASNGVYFDIPATPRAAGAEVTLCRIQNGSVWQVGIAFVTSGQLRINIGKIDDTNLTLGPFVVQGQIAFRAF